MAVEPLEQVPDGLEPIGYNRRYVCRQPTEGGSCFSVGVRDPFRGSSTPIWLRFHKQTDHFDAIRRRVEASDLKASLVESGGHLWFPLDVPLKAEADEMVASLVAQCKMIVQVACGAA